MKTISEGYPPYEGKLAIFTTPHNFLPPIQFIWKEPGDDPLVQHPTLGIKGTVFGYWYGIWWRIPWKLNNLMKKVWRIK